MNEQHWLRRLADGDETAFDYFYFAHWGRVYHLALKYLASETLAMDIVQDVFARIWQKRAMAADIQHFEAFVIVVCRNLIMSEFRKKLHREMQPSSFESNNSISIDLQPDEALEIKNLQQQIEKLIDQLPSQQQSVFRLSRNEGLSYAEIAAQLGITKETVKNHMVRALATLRVQLGHGPKIFALYMLAEKIYLISGCTC